MKELIGPYLKAKESAWAPTTLKSETSRLNKIAGDLHIAPHDLRVHLEKQGYKPYSIKTLFIRLADLEAWSKQDFGYREYLKTHRNRFKHAYVKEDIQVDLGRAIGLIRDMRDYAARAHAEGLLATGCRLSESYSGSRGSVVGKGGRVRKIFGRIELTVPRTTLWRKLKAVGLKPHLLRKLCATRLAENGASAADLCKVFGWSDIKTAYQYLQAKDDERLQALMETCEERR